MEHNPRNLAEALNLTNSSFRLEEQKELRAEAERFLRLVPYELWLIAAPLIRGIEPPQHPSGRRRSQPLPIFAAMIYLLLTGRPWTTHLPKDLCSLSTLQRRHATWTTAGLWRALCAEVSTRHGQRHDLVTWATALDEAAAAHPVNPRLVPRTIDDYQAD